MWYTFVTFATLRPGVETPRTHTKAATTMPTRPPRPCLDCHTLTTTGSRCTDCNRHQQQARNRRRGDRYGTAYRNARTQLLADQPPCHWCGAPATTADHLGDTLNDGLVPACLPCNSRRTRKT